MDTDRLEMAAGDQVNSLLSPRRGVPSLLNQSQLRDCSLFVSLLMFLVLTVEKRVNRVQQYLGIIYNCNQSFVIELMMEQHCSVFFCYSTKKKHATSVVPSSIYSHKANTEIVSQVMMWTEQVLYLPIKH